MRCPVWQLLERSVIVADCIDAMRSMPPESADAIVTDPPYGIGFMGHEWDQAGEHAPVAANGKPESFSASIDRKRWRQRHPPLATGAAHARDRARAAQGDPRPDAMAAGRYDLSATANQRFQAWCEAWGAAAMRVLKPGGHLVAFGSPRTSHRLTSGLEDAGFEIRDSLMWLFGSGFPKSMDLGRVLRDEGAATARAWFMAAHGTPATDRHHSHVLARAGELVEAIDEWTGWGTALKPGYEPIIVARKPLAGTVAANVLEHGTGALNIDGCRIAHDEDCRVMSAQSAYGAFYGQGGRHKETLELKPGGRWPANVALGHTEDCIRVDARRVMWDCAPACPVAMLDEQAGELASGANPTRRGQDVQRTVLNRLPGQEECEPARGADRGGASRFFYCAKASRAERNAGLDGLPDAGMSDDGYGSIQTPKLDRAPRENWTPRPVKNAHPTVKPLALMRWLVRLVTPPDGIVLDPFTGSGTTGCAAALEGFEFVGIERDPEYAAIAEARIAWWATHPEGVETDRVFAAERERHLQAERGQLSIDEAAA